MRRVVLTSADLSGDALNELKLWLAIGRDDEDAALIALLQSSLDMCEGFLGQRPLIAECEELAEDCGDWLAISSLPVKSVLGLETLDEAHVRSAVSAADYDVEINANGMAQIKLLSAPEHSTVAIRFRAGIAETWAQLPGALRHGIIRLAAFHYRERDNAKAMPPPASVTALWRPWRQVRLT